jgi:hypothetical protein
MCVETMSVNEIYAIEYMVLDVCLGGREGINISGIELRDRRIVGLMFD